MTDQPSDKSVIPTDPSVIPAKAGIQNPLIQLHELRDQIDIIDDRLLDLLVDRFVITRQVGVVKRDADLPPADPRRETEMYARLRAHATDRGLDPQVIEDVYRALLTHVKRQHAELR